jgi:hypothetical protein
MAVFVEFTMNTHFLSPFAQQAFEAMLPGYFFRRWLP